MTPYQEVPVASALGSSWGEALAGSCQCGSPEDFWNVSFAHAMHSAWGALFSSPAASEAQRSHLLEFPPHPFSTTYGPLP